MAEKELLAKTREKMDKTLELLKNELATLRVGRASSSLVENILVEAYGTKMRILELALISSPEPNRILIKAYDPGNVEPISRAILGANLGFSPVVDAEFIRITIPPLTTERREEMVKLIGQRLEGSRISIRQIRQEAMKEIDQDFEAKQFSEDEKFRFRGEIQKTVEEVNEKVENLGKAKEQELMEI